MRVRDVMTHKRRMVHTIAAGQTAEDAIVRMTEQQTSALIVMDGDTLLGIVTERDYARKVILKGRGSETTRVEEIMSTQLITATTEQTVRECMTLMTEQRIRHLPVVAGDTVIGMISIGDLVKATIDEKDFVIDQLKQYIKGGR